MTFDNIRPLSRVREDELLRLYQFLTDNAGRGWSQMEPEPERRIVVEIACGRCGEIYRYFGHASFGRRLYCDACVRT